MPSDQRRMSSQSISQEIARHNPPPGIIPEGVAMHRTHVHEMGQFQSGKKRVAIISDAASLGISLHASNRAENRERRVHVTLEPGWSADKQMQAFERTHRSDQAMPPEYVLLSTEPGGEKRFSSTIARLLGSLGALTKGDRRGADNSDLAKYNFETEEGRAALCLMLRRIVESGNVPGLAKSASDVARYRLACSQPRRMRRSEERRSLQRAAFS